MQSAPSPAPASSAPGQNEGQWIIRVDANCANKVTMVDLYVDNMQIGTVAPGRGVVKNVPIGRHTVSGLSPDGQSWGPLTYDLTQGVRTTSFSCN